MKLYKSYTKEIHKELDHFAHWMPSDLPVKLGDYGTMEGKRFNYLGNIKEFGKIKIKRSEPRTVGDMAYSSKEDVDFHTKVQGNGGGAKGSVDISFKGQNAVFLKLEEVTSAKITNLNTVEDFLVDVYKRKGNDWMLKYVVVTERIISKRFLIAISEERDTRLTLEGKVSKGPMSASKIELEDLSFGKQKGIINIYDNPKGVVLTPLFRLHEIKDPITKKPHLAAY
jgi:hypothetical protein